jgi:lipoate-protein ligase B
MTTDLETLNWGRLKYQDAWARQKELLDERIAGTRGDTLIFVEHDPVITLGRGAQRAEGPQPVISAPPNVEILKVERGGLVTYHGPGQLVMYPIVRFDPKSPHPARRSIHALIRGLEDWVSEYLLEFKVSASCVKGKTGVWVNGQRKIASIGIAARHWVSWHGLSLNLSTGPAPWTWIEPCGFESGVMTDLERESGQIIDFKGAVQGLMTCKNII